MNIFRRLRARRLQREQHYLWGLLDSPYGGHEDTIARVQALIEKLQR